MTLNLLRERSHNSMERKAKPVLQTETTPRRRGRPPRVESPIGAEPLLSRNVLIDRAAEMAKRMSLDQISMVQLAKEFGARFAAIADPNLALIILVIGGLCIYIEFTSPGLVAPGVIGAIMLLSKPETGTVDHIVARTHPEGVAHRNKRGSPAPARCKN